MGRVSQLETMDDDCPEPGCPKLASHVGLVRMFAGVRVGEDPSPDFLDAKSERFIVSSDKDVNPRADNA